MLAIAGSWGGKHSERSFGRIPCGLALTISPHQLTFPKTFSKYPCRSSRSPHSTVFLYMSSNYISFSLAHFFPLADTSPSAQMYLVSSIKIIVIEFSGEKINTAHKWDDKGKSKLSTTNMALIRSEILISEY